VFDGQIQLTEIQGQQSPITPSASTSTFSLSLDPIAESIPAPFRPSIPATPSTVPYLNGQQRQPSKLGLGHPRTKFSSNFPQPNTELILYSYAQLTGSLSITPIPGITPSSEHANILNSLRSNLLKQSVIGGGSMDITSSLHSNHQRIHITPRRSHKRSTSFSSGLLSFITIPSLPSAPNLASASTPSLLSPSQSWSPSHRSRSMSQSVPPSPSSPSGFTLGSSVEEEIDPETPLPTFEVPQVMLAVDLSLGPGESRTCAWFIRLLFYIWISADI
jgi:hypothetical protein